MDSILQNTRADSISHAFEIVPEYFWEELNEDERARRIESYRKTFETAKRKVLARKNSKPEFWFSFGGGI